MHGDGHHEPIPEPPSHREVALDALAKHQQVTPAYWRWVLLLGALSLLGVVGFVIRAGDGFDEIKPWGYHVGTMAFIFSTFTAAPIVSAGLRLTKAHFRRPITRIAELHALSGLIVLLMLIPALRALPTLIGRPDIWFDFGLGSPDSWELVAMAAMLLAGVLLLWVVALPDLAAVRDHMPPSARQRLASMLSLGWVGNLRAWRVHYMGSLVLGGSFLLLYPLIQTLFSSDFHLSLVPGLKDAIFPATMTLVGMQGAVATTIVAMFIVRRFGGYEQYIGVDQFWALSKPLLAFSLLWFYFWWASFLTFWYGRTPAEVSILQLLFLGPYKFVFMASLILNFLGPLLALMWNPVRRSVWGPTIVSVGILIGTWLNSMRIYASAASVRSEEVFGHYLETVPPMQWPDLADVMLSVGAISASALVFLLAAKIVPVISIWEVGEGLRLVKVRRYYHRWVRVIAKSH